MHRLRHPLRVRHLPADLRRRPAGRAARHLAGPRRPVGVPAPRGRRPGRLRRPHRDVRRRRRRAHPLGPGLERARRPLQLHGPRLPERPGQHAAAVERPGHQGLRPARSSTPATTPRPSGRRPSPRTSPRCSTPRTPPRRARSCACSSSTSSSPARSATSSTTSCRAGLRPARPARAGHLPAQRHPPGDRGARADARSWSTRRSSTGTRRGRSPSSASPTPATRCCPRRSRSGRSTCSAGCCRGTWRSSTGSTTSSSPRCARPTPTTSCGSGGCRSSPSTPTRAVRMAYLATVAGTKVNGVAELHSQLLRDKVLPDFSELLAGEVHQRHQRRHAAPVPPAGQPVAVRADHRRHRRRAGSPTWSGCASSSPTPRTRSSARAFREVKDDEQDPAERPAAGPRRHRPARRPPARRDGQAPARVQAADR